MIINFYNDLATKVEYPNYNYFVRNNYTVTFRVWNVVGTNLPTTLEDEKLIPTTLIGMFSGKVLKSGGGYYDCWGMYNTGGNLYAFCNTTLGTTSPTYIYNPDHNINVLSQYTFFVHGTWFGR